MDTLEDSLFVKARAVAAAGGIGMIVVTANGHEQPYNYEVPTTLIGLEEGQQLIQYLNTTK